MTVPRRGLAGRGRALGSRRSAVAAIPEAVFAASAVSRYLAASLAVVLFDRIDPLGVAWFRMAGAALILVPWRRPWQATWTTHRVTLVLLMGATMAALNSVFYLAISHLPLGTTVAIEMLGPISVAAALDRRRRNLLALLLVGIGVYLISDVRWEGSALGVVLALASAACWGVQIILSSRVARDGIGVDGVAVAFVVGAVISLPISGPAAATALSSASLIAMCVAIGIFAGAIPYVLDQLVLAVIPASRFALLQSVLPVTAAIIGFIVLTQVPSPTEAFGISLVVIAIAARDRSAGP